MVVVYFIFIVPSPSERPPAESPQHSERQVHESVPAPTETRRPSVAPSVEESTAITQPLRGEVFEFSNGFLSIRMNALGEVLGFTLDAYEVEPDSGEAVSWDFGRRSFNQQQL